MRLLNDSRKARERQESWTRDDSSHPSSKCVLGVLGYREPAPRTPRTHLDEGERYNPRSDAEVVLTQL